MSGVHSGHRERMKEQFLNNGIDSFLDHQILEMVLFYTLPRIDTNPIAHDLIERFGSLRAVFDAPVEELVKVKGITSNSAVLLKLIPEVTRYYSTQKATEKPIKSKEDINDYFKFMFVGETDELVKVCILDDELKIQSCVTIEHGIPDSTPISARKIAEVVFKAGASSFILAHNHPNGTCVPSSADISVTRKLRNSLREIGITMLDHVVVGADTHVISMKASGYFDAI